MNHMNADFIIIAALKDEAAEIRQLLNDPQQDGPYIIGKLERWKGRGEYSIAIVNLHDGMGSLEAGPATLGAIAEIHPRAVLMTGIAAGFEESKAAVQLGDLMVPCGIVPYELAKLKGESNADSGEVQHRGIAWAVSESLWKTAATTADDAEQPWLSMITAVNPGGGPSKVHAIADSILGSGEKIVADVEAEVRKWLLDTYPRQALGLEMESCASLRSCRYFDTPFLIAKASVDKATVEKDDRWRTYACQFSAAFLLTVLKRYEQPQYGLLRRHTMESEASAATIAGRLPQTDFGYKILTAVSFEQLRQGIYEHGEKSLDALMPNDVHQNIVLYGGGGAGKSTLLRRLFLQFNLARTTAVLIDLKPYSQEYAAGGADDIDSILKISTFPRRTSPEIEQLAAQQKLTLLIDGVNEVSTSALASVISFCRQLRRGPGCFVVWANRMTLIEGLSPSPCHATVGSIPTDVAQRLFDDKFGMGIFATLSERLRAIYQRPFFLDLALRSGRAFSTNRLWTGIFSEFFKEHLAFSDEQINHLSIATRNSIGTDGKMRMSNLKSEIGDSLWHKLEAANVEVVDATGFEHHLWRDYLVARSLSLDQNCWTDETFDVASTFGTSVECLTMAVEQIRDSADKVAFVNAVYDWNYGAALECIARSGGEEEEERRVPDSVREAILAVVAEKRFDGVERTRQKTDRLLAQYPFATPYLLMPSRDEMVTRIQHLEMEGGMAIWQRLYCQPKGTALTNDEIDLIESPNSLIGWTAANYARRGTLSDEGEARIRAIYEHNVGQGGRRSVRWRVVHALGQHLSDENLVLLGKALQTDEYRWVLYGAARSLVEAASKLSNPRRQAVIDSISSFVDRDGGGKVRTHILHEIVESCFIDNASRGWGNAAIPLMEKVLNRIPAHHQQAISRRISAFREQFVNERRPRMGPLDDNMTDESK